MKPLAIIPFATILAVVGLALIVAASGCGGTAAVSTPAVTGTSAQTAIWKGIGGSIGGERDFMNRTSCDGGGFYVATHEEVDVIDGRHINVIDARCTEGDEVRQFYFDISNCFPCTD